MLLAHSWLEIRFATNSLAYLARGMDLGDRVSRDYPTFQTNSIAITFQVGEECSLAFDIGRILIACNAPEVTIDNSLKLAAYAIRQWNDYVGELPAVQRMGFRTQSTVGTSMTRRELIDVYGGWLFQDTFRETLPRNHDFALTIEDIDGADGERLMLGMMGFDELLSKWNLREELVESALSFVTMDIDFGSSHVKPTAGDVEAFVRSTWDKTNQRRTAILEALPREVSWQQR